MIADLPANGRAVPARKREGVGESLGPARRSARRRASSRFPANASGGLAAGEGFPQSLGAPVASGCFSRYGRMIFAERLHSHWAVPVPLDLPAPFAASPLRIVRRGCPSTVTIGQVSVWRIGRCKGSRRRLAVPAWHSSHSASLRSWIRRRTAYRGRGPCRTARSPRQEPTGRASPRTRPLHGGSRPTP